MHDDHHEPFVMKGNFSKEFLESMGMVRIDVPLYHGHVGKIEPLPGPLSLAYFKRCQDIEEQTIKNIELLQGGAVGSLSGS